jgi:hypothetical protein
MAVGCTSGDGAPSSPGGATTITKDETWAAGKQIAGAVLIAPGATVTIEPSAIVTLADGATITVGGSLKSASPGTAHAKLTGGAWGGIVVESGGTLSLDGVDMQGPATAIVARGGDAEATFANGTITAPGTPFKIDVGGKLSFSHATIAGSRGTSTVGGALTASYLDYDSGGSDGITATDDGAVITIDDSTLHGQSDASGDMIVADNAATVHVAHSDIEKCHSAFRFGATTSFDVSFVSIQGAAR